MPYVPDGTLVTDKRTINDSDGWDSQSEWEAYQSANGVEIVSGAVELAEVVIPDAANHLWRMDEGSGDVLDDSVGGVPATLVDGGWTTGSGYSGGAATTYDGTDDYGQTDSPISINGTEYAAMGWFNFDGVSVSERVFKTGADPDSTINDGWNLRFTLDGLTIEHWDGGENNNLGFSTVSLSTGVDYFLAVAGNGNSASLYIYDVSHLIDTATGSGGRGQTPDDVLMWMGGNGLYTAGTADNIMTADVEMSQTDIETVWNSTGPNG